MIKRNKIAAVHTYEFFQASNDLQMKKPPEHILEFNLLNSKGRKLCSKAKKLTRNSGDFT